jgi:perosamine synthetase
LDSAKTDWLFISSEASVETSADEHATIDNPPGAIRGGNRPRSHPLRIPIAHPTLNGNEARYLVDCVESGWVSSYGSYVDQFESDFATFCQVSEAISCSSGTAALHLALVALGLQEGDEVVVPALTYIATANTVRYCSATPVFVDSDATTLTLDPTDVERHITPRTRAIVPVHLFGQCADMGSILEIAQNYGVDVIEDAAQAHGALFQGRPAGSMGTAGTFSFFGNKVITTGEGGMVTLRDLGLAQRIRSLRNQGSTSIGRYRHSGIGFNYRMTNLQAAVGVAQMERIDEFIAARMKVADWYNEELLDIDGSVQRPSSRPGDRHVHWMYTIVLGPKVKLDRDELIGRLFEDGIETRPVFPPVYEMPPYDESRVPCPVADYAGSRGLCLPTHPLVTRDEVSFIVSRIRAHVAA